MIGLRNQGLPLYMYVGLEVKVSCPNWIIVARYTVLRLSILLRRVLDGVMSQHYLPSCFIRTWQEPTSGMGMTRSQIDGLHSHLCPMNSALLVTLHLQWWMANCLW